MCLTKRIVPCEVCVTFDYLTECMDIVEDKMENNTITEGVYLKKMDKMKKDYDYLTEYHKTEGCSDCIMDDKPDDETDDDDDDYDDDEITVEPFEWRGTVYLIQDAGQLVPDDEGRRRLFDYDEQHDVGFVTSAGAVILE